MNQEQIYEQQVDPLMSDVIAICKENGIAMLSSFQVATPALGVLCITTQLPDAMGTLPEHFARAARELKQSIVDAVGFVITTVRTK